MRFRNIATLLAGSLLLMAVFAVPTAQAAPFTELQIQAILSLLSSFDVDATIINNVEAALRGEPSTSDFLSPDSCAYASQITRTLYKGISDTSTGGQVTELQRFLAEDPDIYPEALVTGYYGPATERAVQRWQERNGVVSWGTPETTGYGVVGPLTRGTMAKVCSSSESASTRVGNTTNANVSTDTQPQSQSPDGLYVQEVVVGTGAEAVVGSLVAILYTLMLPDGSELDSSAQYGDVPIVFTIGGEEIGGWFQVSILGMREGGRRIVTIPPSLGYGSEGVVDSFGNVLVPPNATLIFDVELVDVAGGMSEDAPLANSTDNASPPSPPPSPPLPPPSQPSQLPQPMHSTPLPPPSPTIDDYSVTLTSIATPNTSAAYAVGKPGDPLRLVGQFAPTGNGVLMFRSDDDTKQVRFTLDSSQNGTVINTVIPTLFTQSGFGPGRYKVRVLVQTNPVRLWSPPQILQVTASSISLTASQQETMAIPSSVFTCPRGANGSGDISDMPLRLYRDSSNFVRAMSLHRSNLPLKTSTPFAPGTLVDLSTLQHPIANPSPEDCEKMSMLPATDSPDPSTYKNWEWIVGVYTLDGERVHGYVHNEFHGEVFQPESPGCTDRFNCWYTSITKAISFNGGDLFRTVQSPTDPLAHFLFGPAEQFDATRHLEANGAGRVGAASQSNVFVNPHDRYYYMTFARDDHPEVGQVPGSCLVRSRNLVGWYYWDGTGFTKQFVSPYDSAFKTGDNVCTVVRNARFQSIVFSEEANMFVALANTGPSVSYFTSSDLIHWSRQPELIAGRTDTKNAEYPVLLDLKSQARNFDTIGKDRVLKVFQVVWQPPPLPGSNFVRDVMQREATLVVTP